jgi:photosystem II stability/assembly factor-like uncharacterized protein
MKKNHYFIIILFSLSISLVKGQGWIQNTAFSALLPTGYYVNAIMPVNDNVIWLLTSPLPPNTQANSDSKLLRTLNGGNNWEIFDFAIPSGQTVYKIVALDSLTVFVLTYGENKNSAVYKTTNGARSWTEKLGKLKNIDFINFFDSRNGIIIGVASNLIAKTVDGGDTWQVDSTTQKLFAGQLVTYSGHAVQNKDTIGFTTRVDTIGVPPSPRFYRSTDRGVTWKSYILPYADTYIDAWTDFKDGTNGMMATVISSPTGTPLTNLLKTINGGETWEKNLTIPSFFYNMQIPTLTAIPNSKGSYIIGGVYTAIHWYYTIDDGLTWKILPNVTIPSGSGGFSPSSAVFSSPKVGWFAMSFQNLRPRLYKWDGSNVLSSNQDLVNDNIHLTISPNPSTGIVQISSWGDEKAPPQYLRVTDALGRIVYEKKAFNVGETTITLDLQAVPNGVYFIDYQTVKSRKVEKIQILH